MVKKAFLLLMIMLFVLFYIFIGKGKQVISEKDFAKMVDGQLGTIEQVLRLFPKSVKDVEKRVELVMNMAKQELEQLLAIKKEERTFDNTPRAYDTIQLRFSIASDAIEIFEMITPDDAIRNACHDAAIKLNAFSVDLFFQKNIY